MLEAKTQTVQTPIYLDYAATTPVDGRVLDAMLPYFREKFGNPHSRTHSFGWVAEESVELARTQVAQLINADKKEIVFTSGATESNNLAIKGILHFYGSDRKRIITLMTEHKCVLDTMRQVSSMGYEVVYMPVGVDGIIDLNLLEEELRKGGALLVSVLAVHNEIGVIQPLKEIGALCRKYGAFFHSDIAQAFGKIPIDVEECNLDLASISGHKIYASKGIGALYVRKKPRVRLSPIINGGGQERGMRSGTLPTPLIVGLGVAARIAQEEMAQEYERIKELSEYFIHALTNDLEYVTLNGSARHRYPGIVNINFAYVEGESMILAIKDLAVSSGSACTSASLEPSYVLRALGLSEDLAHTSIRFSFGRFTKEEEVKYAVELIKSKLEKLRNMSPLWEMVRDGVDISAIQWNHQ
ncbi:Cysteine desulfurase [Rickettsiales endosymbiont of Paramecium tredecaurelia]|uniref:IscS subfamily cysteine desulfurase n=1 Tax=Candidatus Sarmatiella mevalonica TaxID=2770581 RepID=UPI001924EB65|nr:IscS subfamily cysteine desulfurase [Candidatus Sarmatiella mevalonica]MBL3284610.1 Cysteine desulfurase [Candidatus Sarmatiella mevalonica]